MIAIFCLNFVINNILGGFYFKTTNGQRSAFFIRMGMSDGVERERRARPQVEFWRGFP